VKKGNRIFSTKKTPKNPKAVQRQRPKERRLGRKPLPVIEADGGGDNERLAHERQVVSPSVGFLVGKPEGVSAMQVDQVADDAITNFRENFRYEDHPGSWQPSVRVKEQDRDGVEAEVLFSSWARTFYSFTDAAFQRSCFRSYNLWLHEFCSYDPKRLIGVPLLSVLDVEKAVQDLNEYAKMGFKGVQLPSGFKDGVYYDPIYEPIWSAAEDSDMLMIIHSGALQGGGSRKWFEKLNSADDWPGFFQHSRQTAVKTVIGQMIFSGVFDRHPSLKVVCTEFDAGWLGVIVQQVDYHYGPKKAAHGTDVQLKVKLPPSEYFKRNLWFTFMDDRAAVLTTPIYGEDNFLWSSDYPHAALLAANRRSDVRRRERDGEKETVSGQRQQTLRSGSLERIGSEYKEKKYGACSSFSDESR
jgi:uncharacterized protein